MGEIKYILLSKGSQSRKALYYIMLSIRLSEQDKIIETGKGSVVFQGLRWGGRDK